MNYDIEDSLNQPPQIIFIEGPSPLNLSLPDFLTRTTLRECLVNRSLFTIANPCHPEKAPAGPG